ncbi:MAG TPA: DUF5916 domain-containing protein [Thermoanaerobaculia bacterium]|jgi:hypothetical protein|nr:DUF5916 domain-containing protein [Thermoanaerobaculia bacterium]
MRFRALAAVAVLCAPFRLFAAQQPEEPRPKLKLARITTPITVDGDLSDPGWKEATVVDVFYEINPGDNIPPPVKTVARIGYDDRFFYVSFWCQDPDISKIRAPFVDRDGINDDQDYVGVLLDVENTNHAAIDFWIGPRGIQADSVFNEGTFNEDFGPDYFWESAGRIGTDSWSVEVAIPLASLRYPDKDPQDWALELYRVYPREFNYQFYNVKVPHGVSCFLCQSATVEGITGLPHGLHYVVAPYAGGTFTKTYPGSDDFYGDGQVAKGKIGLDAKILPNANTIVDATVNPDFSQVESDVAQVSVNKRFALFYPEKRPFFLEHLDLLQTPIQAVYTRTITAPFWGTRITGKSGSTNFTGLVADDRGGGTVVIPGPVFSDSAPQDFHSVSGIARVRQDVGNSYVGFLGTARAIDGSDGGGYNYVGGGDFQWRANDADIVNGQYLYSVSKTPDRPDLYPGWTGDRLSGFGWMAQWTHSTRNWQWDYTHADFADGFRADDGFVPQVGYRQETADLSYRFFTQGFFTRIRPLVGGFYSTDRSGELLARRAFPGIAFQGQYGLRGELDYDIEAVRISGQTLEFNRLVYTLQASPSRLVPRVSISGNYGEQADVDNVRVGTGGSVLANAVIRPTDHLALDIVGEEDWLDETVSGFSGRLFTAFVARMKATYVFNSRTLVRLIGQYVETTRDPSLWTTPVAEKEGAFSGSVLFSYKLNWQTVLFLGYGDNRALTDETGLGTNFVLKPTDRQVFLKVSYAFQR